jgi:hypothetical protein
MALIALANGPVAATGNGAPSDFSGTRGIGLSRSIGASTACTKSMPASKAIWLSEDSIKSETDCAVSGLAVVAVNLARLRSSSAADKRFLDFFSSVSDKSRIIRDHELTSSTTTSGIAIGTVRLFDDNMALLIVRSPMQGMR